VSGRPITTLRDRRLAEAAVLVVMVTWAANFIVVKAAIVVIPPIAFAALRFGLAGIFLLVLLRWREGSIWLPRRDALAIAGLGVLGFGIYQVLWATALHDIAAGDSAILVASTPIFTALLAVAAGSDVLTPLKLAGALISFLGVGIVIAGGHGLALGTSLVGDALTIVAAVCWAGYSAFGAPILRRHSPLRTSAWAVVAGAVFLAVPGIPLFTGTDLASVGGDAWAAVLFSALIPAGVANVVVLHGIKLLGPTRVTTLQYFVPAFAVVLAFVFLHEPIRLAQVLGGVVIVVGILISRRGFTWPARPTRQPWAGG